VVETCSGVTFSALERVAAVPDPDKKENLPSLKPIFIFQANQGLYNPPGVNKNGKSDSISV
jgi:hypothetical protein